LIIDAIFGINTKIDLIISKHPLAHILLTISYAHLKNILLLMICKITFGQKLFVNILGFLFTFIFIDFTDII